jgi:Uma2 family endonuclease
MSQARTPRWTWDTYVAWESQQQIKHEFVDGEVYAMAGGTIAHDVITNNLRRLLFEALRGKGCRVHGPDAKLATGNGNARYPDAFVDCGRLVPGALFAQEPKAVFEVLSRSTAWEDQTLKLRDYDATPTIQHYVLLNQDEMRAVNYTRGANGAFDIRNPALVEGRDGVVALPALDVTIPLALLHEGLEA